MGLSGAGGPSSLGHPIPEHTEKTRVAGSQSQRGSKTAREREAQEGEKEEWTETQLWERTARAARAAESRVATRARDKRETEGVGMSRTKTGGT